MLAQATIFFKKGIAFNQEDADVFHADALVVDDADVLVADNADVLAVDYYVDEGHHFS